MSKVHTTTDYKYKHISVSLYQNLKWYECVVKDDPTLVREPNQPSKLTCSIRRDIITAERNNQVVLLVDNKPIFWGVITDTDKSLVWCDVTCYDQIYYLSRNKNWLFYKNKTAGTLIDEILHKNHLITNHTLWEDPNYKMPYRAEDNVSYLDMIINALNTTSTYKGRNFYIFDDCKDINLVNEGTLMALIKIKVMMGYIESYSVKQSLSDVYSEVYVGYKPPRLRGLGEKLGINENAVAYAKDDGLYNKYGKLTLTDTAEEGETAQAKADLLMSQVTPDKMQLSLKGVQGDINVRGGAPIWVDFYTTDNMEYIRGWFRVDSATFNFHGGKFTMDLETTLIKMFDDWSNRTLERIDLK